MTSARDRVAPRVFGNGELSMMFSFCCGAGGAGRLNLAGQGLSPSLPYIYSIPHSEHYKQGETVENLEKISCCGYFYD